VEPFTYANGDLDGNGEWTTPGGLGTLDVVTNRAVLEQTFQCGNENPLASIPFDLTLPWSMEWNTTHGLSGGATADTSTQFKAGAQTVQLHIEATNSTADVSILDATGIANPLGNFSTAGTVTWKLVWDGADLIAFRNGTEIGRTVGADITGIENLCQIGGTCSDDTKPWRWLDIRVDHPPL